MRTVALVAGLFLLTACAGHEPPAASAPAQKERASSAWEAARARGIDIVGLGTNPDWFVEIDEGRSITMVVEQGAADDGAAAQPAGQSPGQPAEATRLDVPAPVAVRDGAGRRIYRVEGEARELTLLVTQTACEDRLSGEAYPLRVSAMLDGRSYSGCGRALSVVLPPGEPLDGWVGRRLLRRGQEADAGAGDILERNLPLPYRIFEPGSMGDMMYNPERLNIVVDGRGVIERVYWG